MSAGHLDVHASDAQRWVADLPSPRVQAHAANLMVLPDQTLACVWFGGSMEGRSDISVFMSRLAPGSAQWSAPVQLSDDPERSEQNPILFPLPDGTLWLLHTAQQAGNQDTALVRRRISHDNGLSWGPAETLAAAPAGTFVRQPIQVQGDGSWLLPTFRCRPIPGQAWDGSLDDSAVLRSTDQGQTWSWIEVPDSLGCVHMNIVPASGGGPRLLAFFRSRWADHVYRATSEDGGLSWTAPQPTSLPNNNSSIQALRLADGRLAMIFNASSALDATARRESLYDELDEHQSPAAAPVAAAPLAKRAFWGAPRAPLTLALSEDDGLSWPWQRHLEEGDGHCLSNNSELRLNREYSYPSLRQTADGALHLAYTVFRQHIRHARVMPDWVKQTT
ncbi:exo-alpha-sialidase [Curvibacter sp. RS43]|uniref:sialidase family protein n=1 Tax=Curvibacter microcysteis TaxID=3026419 RepID=UPI00235E2E3B|nr:exo-alpha-sialidase [Curvibacter sp. RS43]MDD0812572.1 exo-alpha-sialidase [Curvibacter sp. RS43]